MPTRPYQLRKSVLRGDSRQFVRDVLGLVVQLLLLAVHFLLFYVVVTFTNRTDFDDMQYTLVDPVTGMVTLWSYLCYPMWLPMLLRGYGARRGRTSRASSSRRNGIS
ncbi:hypothetical protein C8J57DRAFT_1603359 [Mycena rebaudengoi]|nr:hypothetical protein C8J57DRAFT_1603359 [Mycena rebaudengoi]